MLRRLIQFIQGIVCAGGVFIGPGVRLTGLVGFVFPGFVLCRVQRKIREVLAEILIEAATEYLLFCGCLGQSHRQAIA